MSPPAARRDRGFVLVNALVLVAALAATATLLLSRAERGRAQLEAAQLADQLTLALDAFDALALTRLAQDRGNSDHGNESWAQPRQALPLARGEVAGEIQDLQGRFNINWLSSPDNRLAQEAFARLLAQLGLSPELGPEIRPLCHPRCPARGPSRRPALAGGGRSGAGSGWRPAAQRRSTGRSAHSQPARLCPAAGGDHRPARRQPPQCQYRHARGSGGLSPGTCRPRPSPA